ncbi:hypothetical protein MOKP64_39570 [Mycobacterium avium subsp. hominissuis]
MALPRWRPQRTLRIWLDVATDTIDARRSDTQGECVRRRTIDRRGVNRATIVGTRNRHPVGRT